MKNPKEVLQVLKNKILIIFTVPLLIFLFSCAHTFDHLKVNAYQGTIEQVLKVKITNKNEKNKLTIYASVNRGKKQAILDGVAKFDKHVFTLEVKANNYSFTDHINNKQETGQLKEFELVPLDQETLFTKIDINNTQPIIIENKEKELYVEITVLEQRVTK
jgi:hypothetical protein